MNELLTRIFGDMPAITVVFWVLAIVALITFLVKAWPAIRHAVEVVDALRQLPSLVTEMNTTTTALGSLRTQVTEIHHEVHFNNGSSVKDATGRIEAGVAGLYERIDQTDSDLREHIDASLQWKSKLEEIDERTQPRGDV